MPKCEHEYCEKEAIYEIEATTAHTKWKLCALHLIQKFIEHVEYRRGYIEATELDTSTSK